MTKPRNDILQGTLTLLVLRSLDARGPLHGYALCGHIQRVSADLLRVEEGYMSLSAPAHDYHRLLFYDQPQCAYPAWVNK